MKNFSLTLWTAAINFANLIIDGVMVQYQVDRRLRKKRVASLINNSDLTTTMTTTSA